MLQLTSLGSIAARAARGVRTRQPGLGPGRTASPVTADDPALPAPQFLPVLDDLLAAADALAPTYRQGQPFPHAVIDDLIDRAGLAEVAAELPREDQGGWTTWDSALEWKNVFDRPESFGPAARRLSRELNATEFVRFVERVTGVSGLIPDPHLTAAGYFDVPTGGFLRPHIDFTANDQLGLIRRVNAIVYLNADWAPSWGGQLEFWRNADDGPEVEITPELGRLVIFDTPNALHGHPKPVSAPNTRSRLCFSVYFYTSPATDASIESESVIWPGNNLGAKAEWIMGNWAPPALTKTMKSKRQQLRRARATRPKNS